MKKYIISISYEVEAYAETSQLALNNAVSKIAGHKLVNKLQARVESSIDLDTLNKDNNNEND